MAAKFELTENAYCCKLTSVTPDSLVAGDIDFEVTIGAGVTGLANMATIAVALSGGSDFFGSTSSITDGVGTVSITGVTAGAYSVTVTVTFTGTTQTCVLTSTGITIAPL
jgi:hypothetical protein